MSNTETGLAVRKSLVVACPVERAFEVFTREISSWWPMQSHSIDQDTITEIVVEEQVGGRIYEKHSDGGEGEWGKVLAWEPPARFAMTWHPGHDDSKSTQLEVRFAAEGEGTRVELEHTGWEIFAADGPSHAESYDNGWVTVLDHYARVF